MSNDKTLILVMFTALLISGLLLYILFIASHKRNIYTSFASMLEEKKAYFMAKSAIEHAELKFNHMQEAYPENLRLLASPRTTSSTLKKLEEIYIKDLIPPRKGFSPEEALYNYSVEHAKFLEASKKKSSVTLQIRVTGLYSDKAFTLSRTIPQEISDESLENITGE